MPPEESKEIGFEEARARVEEFVGAELLPFEGKEIGLRAELPDDVDLLALFLDETFQSVSRVLVEDCDVLYFEGGVFDVKAAPSPMNTFSDELRSDSNWDFHLDYSNRIMVADQDTWSHHSTMVATELAIRKSVSACDKSFAYGLYSKPFKEATSLRRIFIKGSNVMGMNADVQWSEVLEHQRLLMNDPEVVSVNWVRGKVQVLFFKGGNRDSADRVWHACGLGQAMEKPPEDYVGLMQVPQGEGRFRVWNWRVG